MIEHDHTGDSDLPELRSATLGEAELDALFNDLSACAQIESIRLKSATRAGAPDAMVTLDEAREELKSGRAHGVQIRYVYQRRAYSDTLLRTEGGVRLIRM